MDRTTMLAVWDEHQQAEFVRRDVAATLATMSPDPHIMNLPVLVGGRGALAVARFYREIFIPGIPADIAVVDHSCTVGDDRIVAERTMTFTHDVEMPWILPGVRPTGRRVAAPHVVIVHFAGDKVASEHIYWDQASVLVQVGLLDPAELPVTGGAAALWLAEVAASPAGATVTRTRA
jgi:carboxymethylenebutenolidase